MVQVGQPLDALRPSNLTFCAEVKSLQLRLAELRKGRFVQGLPASDQNYTPDALGSAREGSKTQGHPQTPEREHTASHLEANCAPQPHKDVTVSVGHHPEGLAQKSPSQHLAEELSTQEAGRSRTLTTTRAGCMGSAVKQAPAREGTFPSSPPRQHRRIGAASSKRDMSEMVGRPLPWSPGAAAAKHVSPRLSPSRQSQSLDSSLDQLKSENNRLTEQLVEVSLESAQKFESFSNDRNALLQLAQDLRHQVHNEQAERTKCRAMLTATQDALEALAAENVRITEEIMRSRRVASEVLGDGVAESRNADHLAPHLQVSEETPCVGQKRQEVPDLDAGRLKQELLRRTEEAIKLRQLIHDQTSKANATILDMARRNVDLEKQLQEAATARSQTGHGSQGYERTSSTPSVSAPGLNSRSKASTQPRTAYDASSVRARSQGSASKSAQCRRSPAHGPQTGLRRLHSTGRSARPLLSGRPEQSGRSASATATTLVSSGHTTPRCGSPVWLPSPEQAKALPVQPPDQHRETNATPASRQRSRSSPRLSPSPLVGIDGRYTGRGVPAFVSRAQGTSSHPIFELQQSLDQATAEMRRMQEKALLAAAG